MTTALSIRALATKLILQQAKASGQLKRRARLPRQLPPTAIELAYVRTVRAMVMDAARTAYAPLLRALPQLVAGAAARRGDSLRLDGSLRLDDRTEEEQARQHVAEAREAMARDLADEDLATAARKSAGDVDRHVAGQLGRQIKAGLGIDLVSPDDRRIRAIVEGFIAENVALIQDITPGLASRIEATILKALTTGTLHEDLAKQLQEKAFGYAEERAELIAIDQVGKLTGQLNRQRQMDLGITHFEWMCLRDARVRGNPAGKYKRAKPSHWARNGKRFSWADGAPGRNGEKEFPGTPVRCRCGSKPVLETLLADLPDPGAGWDPSAVEAAPAPIPRDRAAERKLREAQIAAERALWDERRRARMAGVGGGGAPPRGGPPPAPPSGGPPGAPPGGGSPPSQPPSGGSGSGFGRGRRTPEDERELAAARAMAAQPIVTDLHPSFDALSDEEREVGAAFTEMVAGQGFAPITIEELSHAFAPPPGYRATFTAIDTQSVAEIDVLYTTPAGVRVGTLGRRFHAGEIIHGSMLIEKPFQRRGIGSTINGQAFLRYQKWGVQKATVHAMWAGRFDWARLGFTFERASRGGVLGAADRFIRQRVPVQDQPAYLARLALLINEPWLLARWQDSWKYRWEYTDEDGLQAKGEDELGQALLLHRRMPDWHGRLMIDENDEGYVNALRTLRVSERR